MIDYFAQGNVLNLEIQFNNGSTLTGRYSNQDQLNRINFYNNIIRRTSSVIVNRNLLRTNKITKINIKNVREREENTDTSTSLPGPSGQIRASHLDSQFQLLLQIQNLH